MLKIDLSKFDELIIRVRKKTRTWNIYALTLIKTNQYWDKILSLLFKYSTRCYFRKGPLEMHKYKNPCLDLKYFSDNFGRFSTSKTLIGRVTTNQEDIELSKRLFKLAIENVNDPQVCELISFEILAKVMAYRDLKENTIIEMGIRNKKGQLEVVQFVVDTIFDLWKSHVAFGLYPKSHSKEHHPILLFRGTDFSLISESGRASIISDLDPDGPGRRLFNNSRTNIRHWMSQMANTGKKVRVIGHSLGGALALYTLLHEHEYLAKETWLTSYAFNPPGISEELLDEYLSIPKKEKPPFVTYVTRGDIISKFGSLFGDTFEVFTDRPLSPVLAHEQLIFSQPRSYAVKVDTNKENITSSRKYYSNIQKQTTSFAFRFGLKYLFPSPEKQKKY